MVRMNRIGSITTEILPLKSGRKQLLEKVVEKIAILAGEKC